MSEQRKVVYILIGSKLKEIRLAKGISLSELSRLAHVSKSYISDIERGIRENPSSDILEKLSTALNVPVSEFFTNGIEEEFDGIDELEEDMKLLFSKAKRLSKEDRQKVLKMFDIFTQENNN